MGYTLDHSLKAIINLILSLEPSSWNHFYIHLFLLNFANNHSCGHNFFQIIYVTSTLSTFGYSLKMFLSNNFFWHAVFLDIWKGILFHWNRLHISKFYVGFEPLLQTQILGYTKFLFIFYISCFRRSHSIMVRASAS